MNDYLNGNVAKAIESGLPRIDGVTWRVTLVRNHQWDRRGYGHTAHVCAEFAFNPESLDDLLGKVHQVVSAGQIKLELE